MFNMIKIYNTLTKKKEIFVPIAPGHCGIYVCGMTVYDYCHIGHARVMVVFDTIVRYLRYSGYRVTYVRNITDIDDKIIVRSAQNNESIQHLTNRFISAMKEDERALSVLPPDIEPKATQSIPEIISMIERLISNKFAYIGNSGDVFYSVDKFKNYGKLSGKNIENLQAGERVNIDNAKQNPLDFVLWKMAKAGEPAWQSPWGLGRPGWHIECSAMSTSCLGNHFDIHDGGMDLQFPHHENEIAQSEASTGCKFVNYWIHNGFVCVNEEKMSKSLDNFFTIREVFKQYNPEVLRLFILLSHYRSPLNYSDTQLNETRTLLNKLYSSLNDCFFTEKNSEIDSYYVQQFETAMNDDFNTSAAITVLFEISKALNKNKQSAILANTLKHLGNLLGILQQEPQKYFKFDCTNTLDSDFIEKKIQERLSAKHNKNYALADNIRTELKELCIILEDVSPTQTLWRKV